MSSIIQSPHAMTFSDARCAAANTKVESNMSDFEIFNGRLAPTTNDQGAIARGNSVGGTV